MSGFRNFVASIKMYDQFRLCKIYLNSAIRSVNSNFQKELYGNLERNERNIRVMTCPSAWTKLVFVIEKKYCVKLKKGIFANEMNGKLLFSHGQNFFHS